MRGMLIDDDQSVLGLGDDEHVVDLGASGAERKGRAEHIFPARVAARIGTRLTDGSEWGLGTLGEAEVAAAIAVRRPRHGLRRNAGKGRLRERGCGAMTRRAERVSERTDDQRAHAIGIPKPQLGLGGMDVHVDLLRRQRQEQRQHGIASVRHEIAIGRAHGAGQQLVAHRTAIDRQIKLEAVRPVQGRQAGKALDGHVAARGAERQRILDEVGSENAAEPDEAMIEQPGRTGFEPEGSALLAGETEGDLRPRQRQPLHHVGNGGGLDPLGFHEFEPCRRGVEQVAHFDPRARGQGGRLELRLAATINGDLVSLTRVRGAALDG